MNESIPIESALESEPMTLKQLNSLDPQVISFFKFALFKNTPHDYAQIHELFSRVVYSLIKKENRISCSRFYLVFSFIAFKKAFYELIQSQLKELRGPWLLSNCHASKLYGLESKASQNYFQNFEQQKVLDYLSHFDSLDNWVYLEYKKVRIQMFFTLVKNNSNLFLSWLAIVFIFVFCMVLAAKGNSFTLVQQIKVWAHFILNKN